MRKTWCSTGKLYVRNVCTLWFLKILECILCVQTYVKCVNWGRSTRTPGRAHIQFVWKLCQFCISTHSNLHEPFGNEIDLYSFKFTFGMAFEEEKSAFFHPHYSASLREAFWYHKTSSLSLFFSSFVTTNRMHLPLPINLLSKIAYSSSYSMGGLVYPFLNFRKMHQKSS